MTEIEKEDLDFLMDIAGCDYLNFEEQEKLERIEKKYGYWKDPRIMFSVEAYKK